MVHFLSGNSKLLNKLNEIRAKKNKLMFTSPPPSVTEDDSHRVLFDSFEMSL